jgi:DNA end-binding protein Ku
VLDKEVEIKPAELKMAGQVVESMTDDFHPDQFRDDYQEQLHELVQAKLEGGEAFTTEEPEPENLDETDDVSDLLAKLEASVKARKGGSSSNGSSSASSDDDDDEDDEKPAKKAPAKKAAAKKAPAKKTAAKKAPAKKTAAKKTAAKKS